jgi:hypothetical protein
MKNATSFVVTGVQKFRVYVYSSGLLMPRNASTEDRTGLLG